MICMTDKLPECAHVLCENRVAFDRETLKLKKYCDDPFCQDNRKNNINHHMFCKGCKQWHFVYVRRDRMDAGQLPEFHSGECKSRHSGLYTPEKICAHPACNNPVALVKNTKRVSKKHCNDPECIERRKSLLNYQYNCLDCGTVNLKQKASATPKFCDHVCAARYNKKRGRQPTIHADKLFESFKARADTSIRHAIIDAYGYFNQSGAKRLMGYLDDKGIEYQYGRHWDCGRRATGTRNQKLET